MGENKFSLVDFFLQLGSAVKIPPTSYYISVGLNEATPKKRMECRNFGFNKRKWRSLPLLGDAKQPLPSLFGPCPIALGEERDHVSRNRAMKMGNKKKADPR